MADEPLNDDDLRTATVIEPEGPARRLQGIPRKLGQAVAELYSPSTGKRIDKQCRLSPVGNVEVVKVE